MTNPTSTIARGGGTPPAAGRRRKQTGRTPRKSLPSWVIPYALLLPGLLVIAGLLLYPLYQMIVMSTQKIGIREIRGASEPQSLGLENYQKILDTDLFWSALRNTVVFAIFAVTLTLVVGTLVGLLIQRLGKKMSKLVIVGCMAAWAVPPVAVGVIWRWLADADAGIINWFLNLLPDWLAPAPAGQTDWTGTPWLNDVLPIYIILTIAVVWQSFPFIAVSVLAGLKSIPSELYEAAKVDGSTAFRTFRKITLPLLKPVFAVLTVLSIIWDFKVFNQLFILAGGTTNREAFNLSMYAYAEAFRSPPKMGTGAAIAVILTLILLVVTAVYVRQIVKTEDVR
jgi:N,N'-diacetylchitobiose transport system permease protein